MAADIIDNACALEEFQRQQALKNHKKSHGQQPLIINGVRVCLDCEEPITARISILPTVVRCLPCQQDYEKKQGLYR